MEEWRFEQIKSGILHSRLHTDFYILPELPEVVVTRLALIPTCHAPNSHEPEDVSYSKEINNTKEIT